MLSMGNKIGAKGGKRDLRLVFQNKRRKIKKEIQEEKLQKEKQEQEKNKKKTILTKDEDVIEKKELTEQNLVKPITSSTSPIEILEKKDTQIITENSIDKETAKEDAKKQINENTSKENMQLESTNSPKKKKGSSLETNEELNFIETQIVKIIDQEIEEKKFELKKMDSEIYTIQKKVETAKEEPEILELEEQIRKLLERIEKIKKQISSLEKTLDLKFPIEQPDNYLIYLIEEYKDKRKEEIDFKKELQKDPKFKSIMDNLIEIEEAQEKANQKLQEKKENLQLDQEQIEKLQDDIIDIEDMNQRIEKMLEQNKDVLNRIIDKVNETVEITEKVNYITKQVDHSLLELFLLMSLFKRNIGIKNSALAATTAALALDMIIKMTTPIQEKQVIKSIQITDYKEMIEHCLSDTSFLENTLNQNLSDIASLRYTFEHDYKSCAHLSSYQEALGKLIDLEENMKEHQNNIKRMKKEIEYQLDKNNAKVKKYDSK